jgi:hypothetical protein
MSVEISLNGGLSSFLFFAHLFPDVDLALFLSNRAVIVDECSQTFGMSIVFGIRQGTEASLRM